MVVVVAVVPIGPKHELSRLFLEQSSAVVAEEDEVVAVTEYRCTDFDTAEPLVGEAAITVTW